MGVARFAVGMLGSLGAVVLFGVSDTGRAFEIALLDRLEPGQWEVKGTGGTLIASLCLGDAGLLLQPRHGRSTCVRNLVHSDRDSATVRYTCPGNGFGQTTIRLETPRLVQIDSQGLYQGEPFALRGEARRIGPCR